METNIFPLELLGNDNYADWSVKMKNYLLGQGLWNLVETSSKPPKPDDDVVEFEAWRKRNDTTLQAIQSSCGTDILSLINNICSAKIAWEMLAKMFGESNGQDKLIQTEDDDSIINEENSSSSDNTGQENEDYYANACLVKAVQMGNWNATREILELHPAALTAKITVTGGTVLHAAVEAECEYIVEELVSVILEHDLAMQDDFGNTALHVATTSGNHRMAECQITKNKRLVSVRNANGELPVDQAMGRGHKELARYLYSQTPLQDLVEDEDYGALLLNRSIHARDLDMALDLMECCPRLAFALERRDISPLETLVVSTEAFESENRLVFWKRWIYKYCIHISLNRAADQFHLNIINYREKTIESVGADHLWRQLVSSLLNLLGIKCLYEMKLVRVQFQQLLFLMCEAIQTDRTHLQDDIVAQAIHRAISRGNFEFVYRVLKANYDLLWIGDAVHGRSIFHWAVLHRQHEIFSLIYILRRKNDLLSLVDNSNNTILHMTGKFSEYSTPIDQMRCAALQMQREVQWFKEVERICHPSCKERLNNDGLTPRQLFTMTHQSLRKEGEQWMKDTATSCTVIGSLIITIMFTAAFTIPGGNNQDTGLPILIHNKLFTLFIVTDSISLFSSSISVLMFLGILTSRYAEDDFLKSLFRKMVIGVFALFFSIATMMIAFSAALLLTLRGKVWIVIPIIGLASIPILQIVLVQFHLLSGTLISTYGRNMFL